jgi:hypothetical protein
MFEVKKRTDFVVVVVVVAPCILNSKTSHSPTNALFIKLGKV